MIPEVILLLVFARLAFDVQVHGSYLAVIALIVLGAFEFAGIGLVVASRAQTLESVSGMMNLIMLPMWIGSGIFFTVDRFPDAVKPILKVLPLTPLIDSLRAVMLEGTTLLALGPQLAIIAAWGLVTFLVGLKIFRWA
jgi:ABC-type polysaccharide/polyol phosphate export permease